LRLRGLQCAVVEAQNQLMPGQLEATAADQLKAMLQELGVAAYTGRQVQCIEDDADGKVAAVRLDRDGILEADMVVVCAGVTPNIGLAREAGLDVRHGILVDDSMRTSDPLIYAAGECAEHKGRVYGVVGPVIEQAEIACEALRGGTPVYNGSVAASSLKIAGIELFVAGDLNSQDDRRTRIAAYHNHKSHAYRALAIRDNHIVGGVVIGPWPQTHRLRRAIEAGEAVESRQLRRFSRTGQLWSDAANTSVANWACEALVCNCSLVTKGAIDTAIASGAKTRETVSYATGAAKLCGSCKPLIDELLGLKTDSTQMPVFGTVAIVSLIVLAGLAVFLAAPPWPVSAEISPSFRIETLWLDGTFKQITGFALLGSVLIAALLFLRKRISHGLPGSYESWRLVHAGSGGLMIVLLFAHTGFSLGNQLNSWLMMSFLAALWAGTFAGLAAGLSGHAGSHSFGLNVNVRRLTAWLHILVAWPLPLLLLVHILMIYYF
jgi:nitrite reductase (NADH) large subunit